MSLLTMFACEGCGASQEAYRDLGFVDNPADWLTITGPATNAEADLPRHELREIMRHVCSPECLAVLGTRLAANADALPPVASADAT